MVGCLGRATLYLPCARARGELPPTPLPSPPSATHAPLPPTAALDGLLEVQCVQPPIDARRSYFVDQAVVAGVLLELVAARAADGPADGRLTVCTPYDPAFLLIALLAAVQSTVRPRRGLRAQAVVPSPDSQTTRFLPYEDIFETAAEAWLFDVDASESAFEPSAAAGDDAVRLGELGGARALVERLCDVEAVCDLRTYRLSLARVVAYLQAKVARLAVPDTFDGAMPALRRLCSTQAGGLDPSRPGASAAVERAPRPIS